MEKEMTNNYDKIKLRDHIRQFFWDESIMYPEVMASDDEKVIDGFLDFTIKLLSAQKQEIVEMIEGERLEEKAEVSSLTPKGIGFNEAIEKILNKLKADK